MNCRDSALARLTTVYPMSLRCVTLAERTGYTASGVNAELHQLILDRKVERLDTRGRYRFRLIVEKSDSTVTTEGCSALSDQE